ncbi:MAG: hypothetical protein EBZ76_02070 [Synechococcaceae bacterium WB9_2_170]|nr:hypothetical protein [Synechococcaceae bacterium WB9_2_170]
MQYGAIIQTGWRGFSRNALVLVGFAVLYTIVAAVVVAYGVTHLLWQRPLQVVVHLVGSVALLTGALLAAKGQTFKFGQLFSETQQVFNLLGLHVFAAIAILLGLLAFGIPGIYLSVAYWFSAFLLIDQRVSFLDAMAGARALVTPHWFDVAVLLLVIVAISAVGFLACGVGLFATGPLAICIGAAGYLQLAGHRS